MCASAPMHPGCKVYVAETSSSPVNELLICGNIRCFLRPMKHNLSTISFRRLLDQPSDAKGSLLTRQWKCAILDIGPRRWAAEARRHSLGMADPGLETCPSICMTRTRVLGEFLQLVCSLVMVCRTLDRPTKGQCDDRRTEGRHLICSENAQVGHGRACRTSGISHHRSATANSVVG